MNTQLDDLVTQTSAQASSIDSQKLIFDYKINKS